MSLRGGKERRMECRSARESRLRLISKYFKQRQQIWATQTTHAHTNHSISRGTISQALIAVGCSISYSVCQNLKLHFLILHLQIQAHTHTHNYACYHPHINLDCACAEVVTTLLYFFQCLPAGNNSTTFLSSLDSLFINCTETLRSLGILTHLQAHDS